MNTCFAVVFNKTEKEIRTSIEKCLKAIGVNKINWDLFENAELMEMTSDTVFIDLISVVTDKNFACNYETLELLNEYKLNTLIYYYAVENGENAEIITNAKGKWELARNELYAYIF